MASGVFFLILSGLCTLPSVLPRQYHFVSESKTWSEARRYCREKYTDLASIGNVEELNELIKTVDNGVDAWIGLYNDIDSWRWSLDDSSFYTEGEKDYRNWNRPEEPNNSGGKEHCVSIKSDNGMWNDDQCEVRTAFVCYDGKSGDNILIKEEKTRSEAQSYCREKHTDLANVRNQAENDQVQRMMAVGTTAWIGLFRDGWKWLDSDQSSSSFTRLHWGTGYPNNVNRDKDCGATRLSDSGRWVDWQCHIEKPFFCHMKTTMKRIMRVEVTSGSSLDLNDPVMKAAILDQMKQKLKELGMPEDTKLRWREQPDGKVFHEKNKNGEKKIMRRNRDEL